MTGPEQCTKSTPSLCGASMMFCLKVSCAVLLAILCLYAIQLLKYTVGDKHSPSKHIFYYLIICLFFFLLCDGCDLSSQLSNQHPVLKMLFNHITLRGVACLCLCVSSSAVWFLFSISFVFHEYEVHFLKGDIFMPDKARMSQGWVNQ